MAGSDLVISVGANIQQLERQLKASAKVAEQAADDIESTFRKANPTLAGDFGLGVLKGAIAAISFEKITKGFIEANREIASFGETARRVGLDLGKFQELRLAAAGAGIDGKTFDSGIDGLAKALNEARREENELTKLLDANDIKYKDRKGEIISTNEALSIAADLISRAATEQDKVDIAKRLSIPSEFIPLLEGGSTALGEMARKAGELGAVLDSDVVQKAKEFDTAWNTAWSAFSSNARAAIVQAGGWLSELAKNADSIAKAIGNSGFANSLNDTMRRVSPGSYAEYDAAQLDERKGRENALGNDNQPLVVTVRRKPTVIPTKKTGGGGGGGGGKSDEEKAQDRLDRYIESLTRQRNVMEAEIATFGKSNAVKQAAIEIAKAQVDLDKLSATEKQNYIDKLTTEVAKNEEVRASKERLKLAEKGLKDAQQFFGNAATDALEDLIINGAKAEDVVKNLTKQLAKAALQAALIGSGPLAGVFGTAGGLFGALFSGVSFGKAAGGSVNVGQPYTVGERGPEKFVPTVPGRIIPNGGRGAGMTFSPSVTIDARGSQLSESQMRAIVAQGNAQLKAELPGYLVKQNQRGGQ